MAHEINFNTVRRTTSAKSTQYLITNDESSGKPLKISISDFISLFGTSLITSASNGLSTSGNDTQLGGTLIKDTTIDFDTFDLAFTNVGAGDISTDYHLVVDGTGAIKKVAPNSAGWGLTGNSGTTAGTNFIGTTDAIDLVFKANNSEVVRFKSGGNMGFGIDPTCKVHFSVGNNTFNNTDPYFKVSNNLGDYLQIQKCGSLELNNFDNLLGADSAVQDFSSYFRHYTLSSPKNAVYGSGNTYFHITNNLATNSAPYMRAGLNITNSDANTVFKIGLNIDGSLQGASPTILHLVDNFGAFDPNDAGTWVKTGHKIILQDSFVNTGAGTGTVRGLHISAAGGDINQAIYIAAGSLVLAASTTATPSLNMPAGTAPTSPTNGDIWFDGTDIKMRIGGATKTFTLV
jgi:hypothetical protein